MKLNAKLLIIAFILAIFSVGAVAAAENVSQDSSDLTQVPHEQVVSVSEPTVPEVETTDIQTSASDANANKALSSSDVIINVNDSTQKESLKQSKFETSLLGASNDENVLGAVITFEGNTFEDLRTAIRNANGGDIIDLQGKVLNGTNPVITVNKNITIQNGVLDSKFLGTGDRSYYANVILRNISFKNYGIPFAFQSCEFYDVSFDNFQTQGGVFVIRNSKLNRVNFTNCKCLMEEDPDNYETGVIIVTYNSVYDYCNFINGSSKRHSGAICVGGENGNTVNITNSNFINCSAGIGGAVYVHGNNATTPDYHSNIINCKFINNTASQYGGAVGSSQTYLNIQDCEFINNTAKKGAAIMVGGISHGLDGNLEGHYNLIDNCFFHNNTGTEEGGAVHITGNNNKAIDCHFDDNYAQNGNGAAIYVKGENATVVSSEFYHHDCEKGTVYIEGNNANVSHSTFMNNTASKGGAGVYIEGNNSSLNGNYFENNNATIHGGAIHTHGNDARISNSTFINNNAIPHPEDVNQGLGGAIFIRGNDNIIETSHFENNTARNGSAVYNTGKNLTFIDDYFHNNQAWSYLLVTVTEPTSPMNYNKTQGVEVNLTLIGGDNIINAIHNAENVNEVFFHNVTYYHSTAGNETKHTTGENEIHPVDGIENSQGGTLLYQDDREDLQVIDVTVTNDSTGEVIINTTGSDLRTGLFGNLTVKLDPVLDVGNYTIYANHPADENYTAISNTTHFEIRPYSDVSITKTSNKDVYVLGEEAIFTIVVNNDKDGSNVTGVIVRDILPSSLVFVSASPTKGRYNSSTNIWTIGDMASGESQTLTLVVKTTAIGSFNNVVNVTSYDDDWNLSNNIANKTIDVDIYYEKDANVTNASVGQQFEYYIRIHNVGDTLYDQILRVRDALPDGVRFTGDYDLTGANLVRYVNYGVEQIWEITNITAGKSAVITLKVEAVKDGIWNNTVYVWDYPPVNYTVNITSSADLRLIKEVSTETTKKGDLINWTIFVKNEGPSVAIGAYVDDVLPAGLEIYGMTIASKGSYDRNTGRWTIGNMAVGEMQTLIITTRVTISGSSITNNATINSTTPDPNPDNNFDNATTNVTPEGDVGIEKIVSNQTTSHNSIVTWTIRVTNHGPDNATGVYVIDRLPNGLVYINSTTTKGSNYNPVSGRWTIGDLANGESATLTINSKVNVYEGIISNNATVYSTSIDSNPDNNYDENFTQISTIADVGIIKLVSNQTSHYGDEITWTIIVTNYGPNTAEGVYVIDFLPTELVQTRQPYISKGQIAHLGTNGLWTIGDLANGETATMIVYTKVTVSNQTLINVVNVTTTTKDSNLSNNWAENGTYVPPECDVEVIKNVNNVTPNKGDDIVWTITVINTGRDTAENVVVKDILPAGLEYVSNEPPTRGMYHHTTGIWDIGDLEVNSRQTLKITTKVLDTGKITNEVNVNTSSYDINLDNNYDNETIDVPAIADLAIIKEVSNKTTKLGDLINWTVTVTNNGPNNARNVVVKDKLPSGLVYVTHYGPGLYDSVNGIWQIGDLLHIESVSLVITTRVNITNATITNVAVVNSTTPDPNPDNNIANNTTEVTSLADLAIVKTVDDHGPRKGDNITWTITVTNNGPDTAVNAVAIDVIPEGLIFIESSGDGVYDESTDTWTIGDMANGETRVLYIKTKVNVTKSVITNIANVTSDTPDPDETNNEDNSTIDIDHEADLEVIKTVSDPTPNYGDEITWNITVINHGPNEAIEVFVIDKLPAGLIWIEDNGNGAYHHISGIWTIGNLENQSQVTLIIKTKVNVTNATITNIAVVDSDTHDSNPNNNEDNDTIVVKSIADLEIVKEVSNKNPKFGDEITWIITVTNNGPGNASNVTVSDKLPAGLIYKTDDSQGKYNATTGIWTIGDLIHRESRTLVITTIVNITNATITNVAVVNSTTPDPNPGNNKANNTTDVDPEADLEIIKLVSNSTANNGDVVTWTIVVTNKGPDTALNVYVRDTLPTGLVLNTYSVSKGLFDSNTLTWFMQSLSKGESQTLTLKTLVNITNKTLINTVNVTNDVYDPNETNNEANNNTTVAAKADLVVVKVVSNKNPKFGEVITWTVTVTNKGPDVAVNVKVTDKLPAGLIYKTDDSQGKYNATTGIWTIGDLTVGDSRTLVITTIVNITNATITNVAVVNSTTPDPNPGNNKANNTTDVDPEADLEIIKLVSNSTANNGDVVTWTIVVTNKGPDTALNVYVRDTLPTGLVLNTYSVSKGLFDSNTLTWFMQSLSKGESQTLTLKTLVNITNKTLINTVNVTNDVYDPNETNNEANNNTTVAAKADLVVVKVVSNKNPKFGEVITWTVTVTNKGPDVAVNVKVTDKLPAGLIYKTDDSQGKYNATTGIWTIGDLTVGDSRTLVITTIVNITNATITNVAVVNSTTPDPNPGNNKANNTTDVDPEADLEIIKLVSNSTANNGDVVTWAIVVTNKGPDTALNVYVRDTLPAGLVLNTYSVSKGLFDSNTLTWFMQSLSKGESQTLTLKTLVNITNKTLINTVNVTNDVYDPNETNNEANNNTTVPPRADLVVVKLVSNKNPKFGEVITWTVIVTNKGPDVAVNVRVTDKLPAGLIFMDSDGNYDSGTGIWLVGDLANGESKSLVITTRVNITNATIRNIANATSDTPGNDTPGNNTTDVDPIANLEVIKLVSSSTVKKGDIITWTIIVTNKGPDTSINTRVFDDLPSELVYTGHKADIGLYDPESGIWIIGDLANGESKSLEIYTMVNITNKTIVNVANVTSDTPGNRTNGTNNTTSQPRADLVVVKLVSNKNPKFGEVITWTVIVTNKGPDVAVNVRVTDKLPAGLIFMGSDGNYDDSTGLWIVGDLANGESKSLVITTRVNITNKTIENIANATSDTPGNDTPGNNTTDVDPIANLEVIKLVSNSTVKKGDIITWTIIVTNNGPDTSVNTRVLDKLPSDLIYNGHKADVGLYDPESGIWVIGDLANGESKSLEIYTIVNVTNKTIINVANVTGDTPGNRTNGTNNTTSQPKADLVVVKEVSNKNPIFGEVITWTVTVTNKGPDVAVNVKVTDKLPAGLIFMGSDGNYDDSTGLWIVGDLANGESKSLVITTRVNITNKTIENIANATSDTPGNDTPGNNTTDVGPMADLEVVKLVSNSTVNKGDIVTWTIIVTNNGPDVAADVKVTDKLPNGLIYNGHTADTGLYDPSVGTWIIGNMNKGDSYKLVIKSIVDIDIGNITNIAVVNSSTPDNNTDNNKGNNTTYVNGTFDLEIVKLVSNKNVHKGEIINWTITVTNRGNSVAENVKVTDKLPEGLVFVGSNGNYDPQSGEWIVGDLAGGQSASLVITTLVNITNRTITNVANVTSDSPESNKTNNVANNTTDVSPEADLEIIKLVSNATVHKGDIVTWTIVVTNNGPDVAENVYVNDILPKVLVYKAHTTTKGIFDPNQMLWFITRMASGETQTLTIDTLVNTTNTNITNIVNVTSDTPDSNQTNNVANNTTDVPPEADIGVVKEVNATECVKDQIVEWKITMTNHGPDDATDVIVKDNLPKTLIFISSDGNYNPETGIWTIDYLASGETRVLTIITKINTTGMVIVNNVTAESGVYDPDMSNNKASNNTTVVENTLADLEIVKKVSNSNPHKGDIITWTITVTNHGPDTAVNTYVVDKLPNGLIYLSDNSNGRYDPDSGVWTIGNLSNGASAVLNIRTLVNTNIAVVNVAVVTSETPDNNTANNRDDEVIYPKASSADLGITKVSNVAKVKVGDKIVWTITVTNYGPDAASNVRVRDVLSDDVEYISSRASKGSFDSLTGLWTIGDMEMGEEVVLIIECRALTEGTVINIAEVESDNPDPNPDNNVDMSVVSVVKKDSPDIPKETPEAPNAQTMPATGNPILMVLLALLYLVGVTLRRKI